MTTRNYKLIENVGLSRKATDLVNDCQEFFLVENLDYKNLKSILGVMNSVTDKTAGWNIQMDSGLVLCIYSRINDEDLTDDYHMGIDTGMWDVRSTDEQAARKAIREITA